MALEFTRDTPISRRRSQEDSYLQALKSGCCLHRSSRRRILPARLPTLRLSTVRTVIVIMTGASLEAAASMRQNNGPSDRGSSDLEELRVAALHDVHQPGALSVCVRAVPASNTLVSLVVPAAYNTPLTIFRSIAHVWDLLCRRWDTPGGQRDTVMCDVSCFGQTTEAPTFDEKLVDTQKRTFCRYWPDANHHRTESGHDIDCLFGMRVRQACLHAREPDTLPTFIGFPHQNAAQLHISD